MTAVPLPGTVFMYHLTLFWWEVSMLKAPGKHIISTDDTKS
jgi:hypothetical protein